MPQYIKSVEVIGLYQRFDIKQTFDEGINILYGRNGVYKTTLLHILANTLNGDYRRFLYLDFKRIELITDEKKINIKWILESGDKVLEISDGLSRRGIKLREQPESFSDYIEPKPILGVSYFPAFRTILESWSSLDETDSLKQELSREAKELLPNHAVTSNFSTAQATLFSRKLFGKFVPTISYPSPQEIEISIKKEFQEAILEAAKIDREILSQSFFETFSALSSSDIDFVENPINILDEIKLLSQEVQSYLFQDESMLASGIYTKIQQILESITFGDDGAKNLSARILGIYRKSLEKIIGAQRNAFSNIEKYLNAVNEFLEGKKIEVYGQTSSSLESGVGISFEDGVSAGGLTSLSSGERQIITLIYAVTHMSQQDIVLIDEPEISLHLDWQRKLLNKMSAQLPTQQVIVCTHSPSIAGDYPDLLIPIILRPTDKRKRNTNEKSSEQERKDSKQNSMEFDTAANDYNKEDMGIFEEDLEDGDQ